jgi:orotate phosphoribosyltransferase
MIDASERARLIEIVRRRSYGTGVQIKLASGRISDFYFDMKPTMLDPEGATLIGRLLVGLVGEKGLADRIDMVGGLEMGAVPIATAVAMASHEATRAGRGKALPAFFVRKQAKGHGTAAGIDGFVRGESIAGKRVLVLEDVTTTGGSALKAIEAVRAAGGEVVGVATVVDRLEGAGEAFAAAGIDFWPLLTVADFR